MKGENLKKWIRMGIKVLKIVIWGKTLLLWSQIAFHSSVGASLKWNLWPQNWWLTSSNDNFEYRYSLTLKAPNKNCSRWHFNFLLLSFKESKAWFLMWILCLAEDSLETSSLIFSEKTMTNYLSRLLQSWLALSGLNILHGAEKIKEFYHTELDRDRSLPSTFVSKSVVITESVYVCPLSCCQWWWKL